MGLVLEMDQHNSQRDTYKATSNLVCKKTPENRLQLLAQTGVSGLSLDERHDLSNARKELPLPFALQGNLPSST